MEETEQEDVVIFAAETVVREHVVCREFLADAVQEGQAVNTDIALYSF